MLYIVGVSDVHIGRFDIIGESGFYKNRMFCLQVIIISECPMSISECPTLSEYLVFTKSGVSVGSVT